MEKELYFAWLTLPLLQLGWVHAQPNHTSPHAALRACRQLQSEHNLLASSLHDDGESFYVIYSSCTKPFTTLHMPVVSFARLEQILAGLGCKVLDSSTSDEGVPLVVAESALKLALRVHLNQRGWFGVDSCSFIRSPDPLAFPPGEVSSTLLVDAIEMECQLGGDGLVCLSLEASVRRMSPLKLSSLVGEDRTRVEVSECLDRETEHTLADCVVLPSLNNGRILSVSEKTPPSKLFPTEDALRQYWADVYGYRLPPKIEAWAQVKVGENTLRSMTYPLCCLATADMSINAIQTRKRKGEIIQAFLTELKDIRIGLGETDNLLKFTNESLDKPHFATIAWLKSSALMRALSSDVTELPNVTVAAQSSAPATRNDLPPKELRPMQMEPEEPPKPTALLPVEKKIPHATSPLVGGTVGRKLGVKRPKPMEASALAAKGNVASSGKPTKRVKTAHAPDLAGTDIKTLAANDKLNTLSVAQLRTFCKDNNLSTPRKKDELVSTIKKHLSSASVAKEE